MEEYALHTCVRWVPRSVDDYDYIYIVPDRGCYSMVGKTGQFEKYDHGMIDSLGADYDYESIMHYGPRAFSRNGQPTLVPKRPAIIGQRLRFSNLDTFKINKLYNCPLSNDFQCPFAGLQRVQLFNRWNGTLHGELILEIYRYRKSQAQFFIRRGSQFQNPCKSG
ncbi:unnamed protein product [Gongylonema pulchrum]|uniref:Metalloendopeptidase n=1 Tax=Gongylonema pulchrum TaxID=637853 RepID=A0A183ECV8_9BILA|nr:unnamed protein product [Gongylonema pulchrum]